MPIFVDQNVDSCRSNLLLDLLSPESFAAIKSRLVHVNLAKSQVLFKENERVEYVFFLQAGLATLIANTGDNARVQVNMVGREGFAGTVSLFDDDLMSMHSAEIQIAGSALRMPQADFQEALEKLPDFRLLCMRHTKATTVQMSQLAGCNARHSVVQRLCRLLLMVQDRIGSTSLMLTQEELALALALGVRRAGISVAIASLAASRILRQGRNFIEITDRSKLIYETCDCYHVMKNRHASILNMDPFLKS